MISTFIGSCWLISHVNTMESSQMSETSHAVSPHTIFVGSLLPGV